MSCKIYHVGKSIAPLDICSICRKNPANCGRYVACANARTLTLDRALLGIIATDVPPEQSSPEGAEIYHMANATAQNAVYDMKAGKLSGTLMRWLEEAAEAAGGDNG